MKKCVGGELRACEGEKGGSLEPDFLAVRGCLGSSRADIVVDTSLTMVHRVVGGLGAAPPDGDENDGTEEN